MTKAIPEGFRSVTPMCMFKDARKAIKFYKRALGAEELFAMPGPDGKGVMHAEVRIGDAIIMMGEEKTRRRPVKAPKPWAALPSASTFMWRTPTRLSAERWRPARKPDAVEDMFWGDRAGT